MNKTKEEVQPMQALNITPAVEKNLEDIIALTPMQEGMLYHYLKDTNSELYVEQLALDISGTLHKQTLETAWNFVVETNEMLRTLFRWKK